MSEQQLNELLTILQRNADSLSVPESSIKVMEINNKKNPDFKEYLPDASYDGENFEDKDAQGIQIGASFLKEIERQKVGKLFQAGTINMDEMLDQIKTIDAKFETRITKALPKGASNFSANQQFVRDTLFRTALRDHQRKALEKLYGHAQKRDNNNISLIVCPTGAGKTGIAALAPYVLGCSRVLVITPSLEITKQIAIAFNGNEDQDNFYEKIGLISKDQRKAFLVQATVVEKSVDFKKLRAAFGPLVIINAQKFTKNSNLSLDDFEDDGYDLVIIDEAHHYPAPTWDQISQYFKARKLFLTATPYNRKSILPDRLIVPKQSICYEYTEDQARKDNVIRPLEFNPVGVESEMDFATRTKDVVAAVVRFLKEHDKQDARLKHKAMIITNTTMEAEQCVKLTNESFPDFTAAAYIQNTSKSLLETFKAASTEIRILVVCQRLLEGFDHSSVSVTGILRNIQKESKVLFTQFIGRCVRKYDEKDMVTACVIGHRCYKALPKLFQKRDQLASVDPKDDYINT